MAGASMEPAGVLFICLGNICRSPLAHGVMRHRAAEAGLEGLLVDSCGTSSYHLGEAPNPGSVQVARGYGLDISDLRARRFEPVDAQRFGFLVCMDGSNLRQVQRLVGPGHGLLLRDFDPHGPGDVPDPWGGGRQGFEEVWRIVDRSCERLLEHIIETEGLR